MSEKRSRPDWAMVVAIVGLLITVLGFLFGDNIIANFAPKPTPIPTTTGGGSGGACADGLPTRLKVGATGRVTSENNDSRVLIRAEPSPLSDLVSRMEIGEEFTVTNGPICYEANQWWYWKVRSSATGAEGWSAEGDGASGYFLEPVP